MRLCCLQVFCEVEMKRMCLSQANADLAEAAEKLEAIRKKLTVSLFETPFLSHSFFPFAKAFRPQNNGKPPTF